MKRAPRIGLFGGTFDPIHRGHLKAARLVGRRFGLDRILFIPAGDPPHKERPDMVAARHRLRMVRLAVAGTPGWTASPIEIRAGGTSYSIRTIEAMRRTYPGARLFFIAGSDAFHEIKTWRNWRRVLERCSFIVMTRPGRGLASAVSALGPEFRPRIRRIAPRERMAGAGEEDGLIHLLSIPALPISSTDIRVRAASGRPFAGRVPPAVARYIRDHRLYRSAPGRFRSAIHSNARRLETPR